MENKTIVITGIESKDYKGTGYLKIMSNIGEAFCWPTKKDGNAIQAFAILKNGGSGEYNVTLYVNGGRTNIMTANKIGGSTETPKPHYESKAIQEVGNDRNNSIVLQVSYKCATELVKALITSGSLPQADTEYILGAVDAMASHIHSKITK